MAATCFNLNKYLKTIKRKLIKGEQMPSLAYLNGAFAIL